MTCHPDHGHWASRKWYQVFLVTSQAANRARAWRPRRPFQCVTFCRRCIETLNNTPLAVQLQINEGCHVVTAAHRPMPSRTTKTNIDPHAVPPSPAPKMNSRTIAETNQPTAATTKAPKISIGISLGVYVMRPPHLPLVGPWWWWWSRVGPH